MQDINSPLISIIVPIHNAGKYLDKCLSSLINQELKEIEIILVLDCPSDGSEKVAEYFAANDSRIKILYNTENIHTGLSRNKGIEIAKGEYIGFLDHDDFCETEMYKLLYDTTLSSKADIVRCNFFCDYISVSSEKNEKYAYPSQSLQLKNKNWVYDYVCGDKVSCVIWNHIYRADFIRDNNLIFLDSRKTCSEDSVFFMEVYSQATNLIVIPEYLYHHIFHTSNTGKSYSYRSLQNRISFFENLYQYMINKNIEKRKLYSYLADNMAKSLYTGARQAFSQTSFKNAISDISRIRENDLVINCFKFLLEKENKTNFKTLKPTIRFFVHIIVSI